MREDDIAQIAQIESLCFDVPWSAGAFAGELKNPNAHYFVACDGPVVAGYGGFWNVAGEGHIMNIALRPNFQGQGWGNKLLLRMIDEAKKQKLLFLTLEVRASNEPAKALYKKLGFALCGVRKGYYAPSGEDALIMTKTLEAENE